MKPAQVTKADIVKNLAMIIAQVMVRALSREPNAKAVDAIRLQKPQRLVVAIQVNHHIRNANHLPKASQDQDQGQGQGQVNHPMVLVAVNAVAEIALVVIDLGQTDAAIDNHFYSAHRF